MLSLMPIVASFASAILENENKDFAHYLDRLAISTTLILMFLSLVFMVTHYHIRK